MSTRLALRLAHRTLTKIPTLLSSLLSLARSSLNPGTLSCPIRVSTKIGCPYVIDSGSPHEHIPVSHPSALIPHRPRPRSSPRPPIPTRRVAKTHSPSSPQPRCTRRALTRLKTRSHPRVTRSRITLSRAVRRIWSYMRRCSCRRTWSPVWLWAIQLATQSPSKARNVCPSRMSCSCIHFILDRAGSIWRK